MEIVQSSSGGMELQFGLLNSLIDLLSLPLIYFLGVVVIAGILAVLFRSNADAPRLKTFVSVLFMYYYFCLLLKNIAGIPTLDEISRMISLGEQVFQPNINLIPFANGVSLILIRNIFLFIPLGILCPMISQKYDSVKNMLLTGLIFSLFIEISQMFTMYWATDINDLIANVAGAGIGYLCFRLLVKRKWVCRKNFDGDFSVLLPFFSMAFAFILGFISKNQSHL